MSDHAPRLDAEGYGQGESLSPKVRESHHYRDGVLAYRDGLHHDENPYGDGFAFARIAWFAGYFDERTRVKFGWPEYPMV